MLPVQPKKTYRKPGIFLTSLSYATWCAGGVTVIFAVILPAYTLSFFLPIFVSLIVQGFAFRAFGAQEGAEDETIPLFDRVCILVQIIVLGLAILCFAALMLIGGGPDMVDGNFCIVSHGDIVLHISSTFYRVMQSVESGFMAGLLYMFSSHMMLVCRSRRRTGVER